MDTATQVTYMRRAFALARRAEGRTSPNPMVGAVIVKDGRIVGEGYHRRAGEPHAEAEALRAAGDSARGAKMYVTLEPCAHYGRTPPCADALIAAGITEVYYAIRDPDPRVNGKAHAQLEAAGVVVHRGPCEDEARELNRPFFKHVKTGRPFVTAKFVMSLDSKIATHAGDSRWIRNEAARQRTHELRNVTDAILVGAGTVLADDPQLTTRLSPLSLQRRDNSEKGFSDIHHPLRIVADSRGRAPLLARIFAPTLPGKTVLATTDATPSARGVEVWTLLADKHGRLSLPALLDEIGRRGMLTLLVEGGSELLGAFFTEKLVDRVWAFIAPRIIGGRNAPGPVSGSGIEALAQVIRSRCLQVEMIGSNSSDEAPAAQARRYLWIQANVEYSGENQCLQES
jgi:diaminohydroxyphosphoribosylaminopyrimidine deaminase/5-amino-6-(5-phosphoribosylamino)uracil reductase